MDIEASEGAALLAKRRQRLLPPKRQFLGHFGKRGPLQIGRHRFWLWFSFNFGGREALVREVK